MTIVVLGPYVSFFSFTLQSYCTEFLTDISIHSALYRSIHVRLRQGETLLCRKFFDQSQFVRSQVVAMQPHLVQGGTERSPWLLVRDHVVPLGGIPQGRTHVQGAALNLLHQFELGVSIEGR